ncbi:hypothetical protein KSP40_PGU015848 [Platanthera guangdongensis]|uniref:Uncharacterized protein n=1 Tax=Platanthera guangdongensis TaxID=2320717 RepID=A0ABR2LSW6_9ASPA
MLRFFEPEIDTWLPAAATPPLPPRRYITAVDPSLPADQEFRHSQLNSDAPAMPAAAAGRRFRPSALATVDLVKRRWIPAAPPPENTGSRSSSPNTSASSVDSMNSNCCMSISWPNSDANFSLESPPTDPQLISLFQDPPLINSAGGEGCYSTKPVNYARKDQHESMVDWKKKPRAINTMEAVARESKKLKGGGVNYLPLINSTSSPQSKMLATDQEIFKGSLQVMSKSMKIGEKVTALQQLVSPFGKVLSSHYFESILSCETFDVQVKNGGERDHQKKPKSFAEVGLCFALAPVCSLAFFLDSRAPLLNLAFSESPPDRKKEAGQCFHDPVSAATFLPDHPARAFRSGFRRLLVSRFSGDRRSSHSKEKGRDFEDVEKGSGFYLTLKENTPAEIPMLHIQRLVLPCGDLKWISASKGECLRSRSKGIFSLLSKTAAVFQAAVEIILEAGALLPARARPRPPSPHLRRPPAAIPAVAKFFAAAVGDSSPLEGGVSSVLLEGVFSTVSRASSFTISGVPFLVFVCYFA